MTLNEEKKKTGEIQCGQVQGNTEKLNPTLITHANQ